MPAGLDPARAAPLLCAGITTYSPLRHWQVGPGTKVAVAGLGGLGHMGVKLARAMGAEVTVITRSAAKAAEAHALGAQHVLVSSDAEAMKRAAGRFDFVLDTIPVMHEVDPYLRLFRAHGAMVLVGAIDAIPSFHSRLLSPDARRCRPRRSAAWPKRRNCSISARAGHRRRVRDDAYSAHQRSLRADGEGRRAVPLRHRPGVAGSGRLRRGSAT